MNSPNPLHLPGLDQRVLLARGEAGLLAQEAAALLLRIRRTPAPLRATVLLTALPLVALARRLDQLHRRELAAPPPQPGRRAPLRTFRVSYDQLAALMLYRDSLRGLDLTDPERLLLQGVIGKFQQQSLNLSQYLKFS